MALVDLNALRVRLTSDALTGAVILDRRTLESRAALRLFDRLVGVEALILDEPVVHVGSSDVLRIDGRLSALGIDRCRTEIEMTVADSALMMVLTLFPPEGWQLGNSFSGVAETELHIMAIAEPRMRLSTHDVLHNELTVRNALEFRGKVGIGALFFNFGPLFGSLGMIEMSGPIRTAREIRTEEIDAAETLHLPRLDDPLVPIEMAFTAPLPAAFEIPGFALSDVVLLLEGPQIVDWAPYPGIRKAMRAKLDIKGQVITVEGGATQAGLVSLQAQPEDLTFSKLSQLADLIPGVDIKTLLPKSLKKIDAVQITDIDLVIDTEQNDVAHFGVGLSLVAEWPIPGGFAELDNIVAYLMVTDLGRPDGTKGCTLTADLKISNVALKVTGFAPEYILMVEVPDLPISALIARFLPDAAPLLKVMPDIALRDVYLTMNAKTGELSLRAVSDNAWRLPVGADGLTVTELQIEFNRVPVAEESDAPSVTGLISGRVHIAGADIEVAYNFPGDLVLRGDFPEIALSPLMVALAGTAALRDTPMPDAILMAKLEEVYIVIAPGRGRFQAAARTPLGEVEILIRKIAGGSWACAVGFSSPVGWQPSSLSPALLPMDLLGLDQISLILSTSDDPGMALSLVNPSRPQIQLHRDRLGTVEPAPLDNRVRRGLNLFADFALKGTGADEILGLEAIQIYTAIGPRPVDLVLEATVEGNVQLGPDARLTRVGFRLMPTPSNFTITLLGVVKAQIGDDDLRFTGGLNVTPRDVAGTVTMEGDWTEPLGIGHLIVSDVGMELGLSFATLLPTIGIAGQMQIGTVMADAAVRFDTGKPERSLLAMSLTRLMLSDLIDAFCLPEIRGAIPEEARNILMLTAMEDVEIYIAPMPTRIGELEYEQGFRIKGELLLPGFRAATGIVLDPERGLKLAAAMTPIEIAGLFKLSGANGLPGPALRMDLMQGAPFVFLAQGRVELLGLEAEAFVHFHDAGFEFELEGKIFDLFEAHIHALGGRIDSDTGFWLVVEMRNDLMAYLQKEATDAINEAAQGAIRELTNAQRAIDAAQGELKHITHEIERMRGVVAAERARDQKNLQDARNEVSRAQQTVTGIDNNINHMRGVVRKERDRDAGRLRTAQNEVVKAQRDVDKLQREIDSQKKWIRTLKGRISSKKRWLDGKRWYDKTWAGVEYAAYSAARSAEISVAYTKIGGIETAKGVAWGVLEAARAVVREMETSARAIPIDVDPRVAGLFAGRTVAIGTLEGAKGVLRGIEEMSKRFPIDADPRVAGLFTARASAWAAMEGAENVLEGVKRGVGGLADVGTHIAKFGLGGLLDVRRARFETALSATSGGTVDLQLELSFMGKAPDNVRLSFSFLNPLGGAKRLAEQLLPN